MAKYTKATENVFFGDNDAIRVCNVALSYPHLLEPYAGKNDKPGQGKYGAKFLIPKATGKADALTLLNRADKLSVDALKAKCGADNKFIRDGANSGKVDEEAFYTVSASEKTRPALIGPNGRPVEDEDVEDLFYPGAIVNALIKPWIQDNSWGKKCNANLLGVQFVKHGERLGGTRTKVEDDDFEAVADFDGASGSEGFDDDNAI